MDNTDMVEFKCSDQEIVKVEKIAAQHCSGLVSKMIECDVLDSAIPLKKILSTTMIKIFEYCRHHTLSLGKKLLKRYAPNEDDDDDDDDLDESWYEEQLEIFDKKFIDVDQDMLSKILIASNFLEMKSLLNLACQQVADMIKGKTPEQIRKTFNIDNDFTPKEEAQLRKEYAWAFDNP